eukprot:scaffold12647_cov101-Isochrysis_galbana.AAC.4
MSPASASTRNLAIVSGRRISASTCAPGIAPGATSGAQPKRTACGRPRRPCQLSVGVGAVLAARCHLD